MPQHPEVTRSPKSFPRKQQCYSILTIALPDTHHGVTKCTRATASETTLVRASNAANADLIEASFKAIDSNSEDSATLQLYDEPQNVPGTTCYASPRDGQTYYFCYLRYKNYFAHAGITESHPLDDEVKTTPDSGAEKLDPKKTLSQIIAAQYYILEKAPTK